MTVKRLVDVDLTDRADGRVPVWVSASSTHEYQDQAGGSAESWETAIAALSGKVHRWKFDEASGDFADAISTLDLTATGSISYSATSPLGDAASFTGGYAESSGLGSIPTGDAERCIVIVWKKTAVGTSSLLPLFSYGANSSRQLYQLYGPLDQRADTDQHHRLGGVRRAGRRRRVAHHRGPTQ